MRERLREIEIESRFEKRCTERDGKRERTTEMERERHKREEGTVP